MYDAEDDPDRLYYLQGLGRLDIDEDSGDEDSDALAEGDFGWGYEEVRRRRQYCTGYSASHCADLLILHETGNSAGTMTTTRTATRKVATTRARNARPRRGTTAPPSRTT